MGYYSNLRGTAKISREKRQEIPQDFLDRAKELGVELASVHPGLSPEALNNLESLQELKYYVSFDDRGISANGESQKVYELETELMSAMQIIKNDGCVIFGAIEVFGEDSTDIWRMHFIGDKVVREEAILQWPDGTTVDSNY